MPSTVNDNFEARYNLIFESKIKDNADIDVVKSNLYFFYNNDDSIIEQLFSQNSIIIKKNLSRYEAIKFKLDFEKTGAKCIIKESSNPIISTAAPAAPQKSPEKVNTPLTDHVFHFVDKLLRRYSKNTLLSVSLVALLLLVSGVFLVSSGPYNMSLIKHQVFSTECTHLIDFSSESDSELYSAEGMGNIEEWGRWSIGPKVRFQIRLPESNCRYSKAFFYFSAFMPEDAAFQSAVVSINNKVLREIKIHPGDGSQEFVFDFLPGQLKKTGDNVFQFTINHPASPKSKGIGDDTRLLGLGFKSVVFE